MITQALQLPRVSLRHWDALSLSESCAAFGLADDRAAVNSTLPTAEGSAGTVFA